MIRLVDDIGGPAVVALADIVTSQKKPSWNRPIGIGIAVAGYLLGGYMNIGGNFLKQMGVASFPWAVGSIYAMTKEVTPTRVTGGKARVAGRISRYPAAPFAGGFDLKLD